MTHGEGQIILLPILIRHRASQLGADNGERQARRDKKWFVHLRYAAAVAYPGISKRGDQAQGGGIWPGAHTAEGRHLKILFSYALLATAACRESFVTS